MTKEYIDLNICLEDTYGKRHSQKPEIDRKRMKISLFFHLIPVVSLEVT